MVASGALPYTLLLLLLELGVGGALVMHAVHLRGQATAGFVRATTIMVPIVLGLAFWTAFTLEGDIVEGFAVRSGPRDVLVWVLAALTAISVLHNLALYTDRDAWARRLGWVLSGLSLAALGLTAATLSGSPEGLTAVSLGFGALALGLSAVGLALGHWYLVTPRLPAQPLVEITTAFLIVVIVQAVLFGVAGGGGRRSRRRSGPAADGRSHVLAEDCRGVRAAAGVRLDGLDDGEDALDDGGDGTALSHDGGGVGGADRSSGIDV